MNDIYFSASRSRIQAIHQGPVSNALHMFYFILFFFTDVPGPIPGPPTAAVSGKSVVSLSWTKPCYAGGAPVVSYKVEAWLLGEGAMWTEVRCRFYCLFFILIRANHDCVVLLFVALHSFHCHVALWMPFFKTRLINRCR